MYKKILKRISAVGLCIVVSISSLAGCSTEKPIAEDVKKEITLCESWDFEGGFFTVLSPNIITNMGLYNYLSNFYETLVNYEDGKIVPGLAESWDVSDDGLVYTFNLKQGIKFSDGSVLNAKAVKINLENIPKLFGEYNGAFGMTTLLFDKIEAVDEYKVKVYLTSSYYGTLQDFTLLNSLAIMAPSAYNKDGTLSDRTKNATLGTGPYMYDGQREEENYTFVRNPYYNREKPEVDVFHIKVIPNNDAKLLALRSGEIDMIVGSVNMSYDTYNELKNDSNYNAVTSDVSGQTRLLGLNADKEPFNDKAVRLAINYAIDKKSISRNIFYGIEPIAYNVLDTSLPYCNVQVDSYEYNVKKAVKILDDAGWIDSNGDGIREKNGKKLEGELIYINGTANLDDVSATLASFLDKIGMKINTTSLERYTLFQTIAKGDYDIAIQDTYGIPYDPYLFVSNLCTVPLKDNLVAQGFKHIENSNEIIMQLTSMVSKDKIQKKYNYILSEIHKGAALIPLTNRKQLAVYNLDTISNYDFYGQPVLINVGNITLK